MSCRKLLSPCGISCVSYARTDLYRLAYVGTNYPDPRLAHYKENKLHEADPVVAACHVDSTLHPWPEASKCREQTAFFSIAQSFGVPAQGAAVTFATRTGFSVFSIAFEGSKREWPRHLDARRMELNLVAMAFSDPMDAFYKRLGNKDVARMSRTGPAQDLPQQAELTDTGGCGSTDQPRSPL